MHVVLEDKKGFRKIIEVQGRPVTVELLLVDGGAIYFKIDHEEHKMFVFKEETTVKAENIIHESSFKIPRLVGGPELVEEMANAADGAVFVLAVKNAKLKDDGIVAEVVVATIKRAYSK
jgi:hypothetical protein